MHNYLWIIAWLACLAKSFGSLAHVRRHRKPLKALTGGEKNFQVKSESVIKGRSLNVFRTTFEVHNSRRYGHFRVGKSTQFENNAFLVRWERVKCSGEQGNSTFSFSFIVYNYSIRLAFCPYATPHHHHHYHHHQVLLPVGSFYSHYSYYDFHGDSEEAHHHPQLSP